MIAEVRAFVAARPVEFRVTYLAAFALPVSLLIAGPTLFLYALFADTVAVAMGLGAWVVALRRQRDSAQATVRELEAEATRLHLLLTEVEGSSRPNLRVVRAPIPMQRRRDEWDAICQAMEDETS